MRGGDDRPGSGRKVARLPLRVWFVVICVVALVGVSFLVQTGSARGGGVVGLASRATSNGSCPQPEKIPIVQWFHCPKCATSFIFSLLSLLCDGPPSDCFFVAAAEDYYRKIDAFYRPFPDFKLIEPNATWCDQKFRRRPFGGHPAFQVDEEGRRDGMGIFRSPTNRAMSAFHHGYHAFEMDEIKRKEMFDHIEDMRRNRTALATRVHTFINWPGIKGCMTKMLVGKYCGEVYTPSEADVAKARLRIWEQFSFVGITDVYNASVCLMHCMFEGFPLKSYEMSNFREGGYKERIDEKPMQTQEFLDSVRDPWDEAVFFTAGSRFLSDWDRHRSCMGASARCECMALYEGDVEEFRRSRSRLNA